MGVRLINVADGDSVVAIARNAEASEETPAPEPDESPIPVANDAADDAGGDDQGDSGGGAGFQEA